ncbi:MAG: hypothetical protein WDN47_05085 [Candidatus Doudnabacteria bacterium]
MADLDEEELVERQHAEESSFEEQQRQDWEARQQQDRLLRIQQERNPENRVQKAANAVKKIQKWSERYEKASAIITFLAATSEIWVPILIVLVTVMIAVTVLIAGCNSSGISGYLAAGASRVSGALNSIGLTSFPPDVCKNLTFNGGTSGGAGGGSGFGTGVGYTGGSSDAEIRAYLLALGITINKNDCAPGQTTNCTSLDGMQTSTIDEITGIARDCDVATNPEGPPDNACEIQVTGGTEDSHAEGVCSHANGYKVDLASTAAINSYILNPVYFTRNGTRGDGAPLYKRNSDGATYADERNIPGGGPHWDITGPGCG